MKGCSFLPSKRGILFLFVVSWIALVFFQQRLQEQWPKTGSIANDAVGRNGGDMQSLLDGGDSPEILVENILKVDEIAGDEVKNCIRSSLREEPYVVRGFAADWPALKKWNFRWVHDMNTTVDVCASPSLIFKYYSESKSKEILKIKGPTGLPSMFTELSSKEAVRRMMRTERKNFEPLYYHKDGGGVERYYIRFDVKDRKWLKDVDVRHGILNCSEEHPRIWVSVKGTVSPMHWDGSYSCLTQILGTKRMLFYSPDDRKKLGSYPKSHLFWRRSIFDPTNPDYERFPHASMMHGRMTILHPGDMVCFPPKWLHHTDCLTHSISMTLRFVPKDPE